MIIVGAGLSGLIAAHYFSKLKPIIYERQATLPNNHNAVLRFKTDKVAKVTGIPFTPGIVRKAIVVDKQFADNPNPWLANSYSLKVTGSVVDRSVWDLSPGPRYMAPLNFTAIAAASLDIQYNRAYAAEPDIPQTISTMPMPALMEIVGWSHRPKFNYRPIWSVQVEITSPDVHVFQTIYYPAADARQYRASLTRSTLIIEFSTEPSELLMEEIIDGVLGDFGLELAEGEVGDLHEHKYGKILPMDDELRKQFIYAMTREYSIYSLGRFATWKQILLDDVVDDCDTIANLIRAEGHRRLYHHALSISREPAQ